MVLEGNNKVVVDVASKLQDMRSSRTTGTGSGTSTKPKMSTDYGHGMAASVAIRETVTCVLSSMRP